ncbi:hypothetical protein [Actinoallomurus iriomotensis]|uniref:Uncharacterized protein n=1 Tax=Actinoallomurus iriomotensis TaxID=478107 RepID=A0A9W6VR75_9ACTN|nr:hypothetical protein [Actinoallomurus iriomotensis]GLY81923.1 hypothetical protein Airi01_101900 [Actinoallomurus iriomotensis]
MSQRPASLSVRHQALVIAWSVVSSVSSGSPPVLAEAVPSAVVAARAGGVAVAKMPTMASTVARKAAAFVAALRVVRSMGRSLRCGSRLLARGPATGIGTPELIAYTLALLV